MKEKWRRDGGEVEERWRRGKVLEINGVDHGFHGEDSLTDLAGGSEKLFATVAPDHLRAQLQPIHRSLSKSVSNPDVVADKDPMMKLDTMKMFRCCLSISLQAKSCYES